MAKNIWESLLESTEEPTVTLRIPRSIAEELLSVLSMAVDSDDDGMGDDELELEPDDDDGDGDDDDVDLLLVGDGDEDDEDEERDEAADYGSSGGDPSGMRPKTAVGEDYVGFDKLKGKLARQGVHNPGGLAADIGREKYGKGKFQGAAAKGKKLG